MGGIFILYATAVGIAVCLALSEVMFRRAKPIAETVTTEAKRAISERFSRSQSAVLGVGRDAAHIYEAGDRGFNGSWK
jgi:hypothetical protein